MTSPSLTQLNSQFGIPGTAELLSGNGGLPKVHVSLPTCTADVYLHGAQITSWVPTGQQDVLFLSEKSRMEDGRAIRGGIPVCFPWFRAKVDDAKAPAHGFVRTKRWELVSISQTYEAVVITLATQSDDSTRGWWPHDFHLLHRITIGESLELELIVTNSGDTSIQLEEALHTYYRVGDIHHVSVAGLDGDTYLDNMDGNQPKLQQGDTTLSGPTDNAYLNAHSALELFDPLLSRRIRVEKGGSLTTVVWNPWNKGASALADLGDNEWTQMICVEAANILVNAIKLAPAEKHTMTTTITLRAC